MVKTSHLYLALTIVAMIFVSSCNQDPTPKFHTEYFGMEPGRFVVYDVIEIDHDQALALHDTSVYQLKTYWGQPYVDNAGRDAREFIRYKRNTSSDPWVFSDLWTGIIDGIRAEIVEENQRVVKLVFAPTLNKEWDANAYNIYNEAICYYRDIHQDTIINGVFIDSTLVVEELHTPNLIDSVFKYEMYAKNVGLVYKHYIDNHYQFTSDEVVNGKEIYYRFVQTGFE